MRWLIKLTLLLVLPFLAIKFLLGTHQPEGNPSSDQQSPMALISKQVEQVKSLLALGKLAVDNKQLLDTLNTETKDRDPSTQEATKENQEVDLPPTDKENGAAPSFLSKLTTLLEQVKKTSDTSGQK